MDQRMTEQHRLASHADLQVISLLNPDKVPTPFKRADSYFLQNEQVLLNEGNNIINVPKLGFILCFLSV